MKIKFSHLWFMLHHEKMKHKKNAKKTLRIIFTLLLVAAGAIGVVVTIFLYQVFKGLPDINNIKNLTAAQSSAIYDKEENLLYTIHGEENRKVISIDDIPKHVINAVLSIEDDQFYQHKGVDYAAILKASCSEIGICSTPRGGSTITQQFIKNAFLSSERTYTRKLKEIILAKQLEDRFSKDEILEMYLNRIPYGSSIYGIERVANTFFGKHAKDLTLAEAAILASIPKAPTYFSPYGEHKYPIVELSADDIIKKDIRTEADIVNINPDFIQKGLLGKTFVFGEGDDERLIYIKGRVDFVLSRMNELGYITDEEYKQGVIEAQNKTFTPFVEEIKAPHFVLYVRQMLEEKYGKEAIEKGGLKIVTTLDPKMQEAAETAVAAYAEMNLENYKASNASLMAMDPNTGQIFAMVGSVDYWNDEIDGKVNVALRPRLPGSSFKPIVYAAAFLYGYAPSTVLYDVKTKFGEWYEPENYDGEFRGPVIMRYALAHSLNIPAVKAGYLAGIPNVLDLARQMGIQLKQPDDWYGLSLALGAGEARLIDMIGAYSIFANGGYKMDPVSILRIEDRNGNILEEYQGPQNKELILDPQVAYLINNVLSDIEARPEGWWRQQLSIPGQINAAKTGTSNKKKDDENIPFDTWTIGYTKKLAAGVWAGNNDGSYLGWKASGLDTAGRMWHDFMAAATEGMPREEFDRPEGIKYVKISEKTGKLPSEHTPEEVVKTGVFTSFSVPTEFDTSYQILKVDRVSGKIATEYTPEAAIEEKAFFEHHAILPENEQWEEAVRKWAEENDEDEEIPTEFDDVHTADTMKYKPGILIGSPKNKSVVSPPSIGVWVDIDSKTSIEKVDYYWDGELADTSGSPPYKGTIKVSKTTKKGSEHTIQAIVYDDLYRTDQSTIEVKIGKDETAPEVEFAYPGDGVKLEAGTSIATQVYAHDPNGDIEKIEFYMGSEKMKTVEEPPYIWQFTVPEKSGRHIIKAIAYDYAKNQDTATLDIVSKESDSSISGDVSRILEPYKNKTFDAGGRVLIKAYLADEERENLKELIIYAKQKGFKSTEVAKILGEKGAPAARLYTFIWDGAPAGSYELQMKMTLSDDRIRFSEKVPIRVK